jgi:hypothetical protein
VLSPSHKQKYKKHLNNIIMGMASSLCQTYINLHVKQIAASKGEEVYQRQDEEDEKERPTT